MRKSTSLLRNGVFPMVFVVLAAGQPRTSAQDILPLQMTSPDAPPNEQREARGKVFRASGPPLPMNDPSKLYLVAGVVDHLPTPELPAEISDAVLVGRVLAKQVFPATNLRGLYTEYTVEVESVGKSKEGLMPGNSISILRMGGVARLPNGAIARQDLHGMGSEPAIGAEYLFFLTHHAAPADAYTVVKVWNIENGLMTPEFGDDVARVARHESNVDGKAISEIVSLVRALTPR